MFWWILSIEFIGAITIYILDGFLDFDFDKMDEGEVFMSCLLWWLAIPFIIVWNLHDYGKSRRLKREEKRKEVEKLRVAAQKEVDAAMEEVEQETQQSRNSRWH
jgi:hypothetical protein